MPDGLVFAIGASAGGVEALRTILSELPADFPASILIVQHTPENGLGTLADLLARRANIPVVLASDRIVIKGGVAYVAPPGRHMVVKDERIQLMLGPSVNRHRPAIDPLFRSVAEKYGERAVGIILTGYLDDGTAGLIAIKEGGGKVIVQDPDDAAVPSMPLSAVQYVTPDYCVALDEIAGTMIELAEQARHGRASGGVGLPHEATPMSDQEGSSKGNGKEVTGRQEEPALSRVTNANPGEPQNEPHNGRVSVFVCPECLGTLWELDSHNLLQFKCRVGHSFSAETMYNEQAENVEKALWTAVRVLQEHADLSLRLAERARKSGHQLAQVRFENRFKEATRDSTQLQELLTQGGLIDDQDAHSAD
jgi:two-component system chemotaxis response regulator CheB